MPRRASVPARAPSRRPARRAETAESGGSAWSDNFARRPFRWRRRPRSRRELPRARPRIELGNDGGPFVQSFLNEGLTYLGHTSPAYVNREPASKLFRASEFRSQF